MDNTNINIFLQASRVKLRFPSVIGMVNIEDLWDLPLTSESPKKASLDSIGAPLLSLKTDLEKVRGASILADASAPSAALVQVTLQVDILREIARIRQEENKAKTVAAAMRLERERLDALIQGREEKELPLEELKKRRAELGS